MKIEVVHTDAGWHVRLVHSNGETGWSTEVYTRREAAIAAIESQPGFSRFAWHKDRATTPESATFGSHVVPIAYIEDGPSV